MKVVKIEIELPHKAGVGGPPGCLPDSKIMNTHAQSCSEDLAQEQLEL